MLFRSANGKFVHYGGDILSNTDDPGSSHGVHLTGGSTGGVVTACGDEANVALKLTGKGTGPTQVGNSSSPVVLSGALSITGAVTSTGALTVTGAATLNSTAISLNSTKISFAGDTSYLMAVRRVRVDFTIPAMAVNAGAEIGDVAVTGLTTNAVITLAQRSPYNSSVAGVKVNAYCSSAGQMHFEVQNAGTTISGSTMSAYAMIHDFNIPVP